jgi:hypothetical protein
MCVRPTAEPRAVSGMSRAQQDYQAEGIEDGTASRDTDRPSAPGRSARSTPNRQSGSGARALLPVSLS